MRGIYPKVAAATLAIELLLLVLKIIPSSPIDLKLFAMSMINGRECSSSSSLRYILGTNASVLRLLLPYISPA